ncbi:MAG: hypothetical protein H0V66_04560 [Bdellovibrionales bacterium]|nr:hypothetical protein [Bdellovibrionales bacterium]
MKLATLVLTAFLGFGCAAKKMAAQNADVLLENQIEKKLPLYSDQKKQLKSDVDKFLNDQKPLSKEAIKLITSIELDAYKIDQQYDALNAIYSKLALNFTKVMSKYMSMLDEKQQKEFNEKLDEENKTLAKSKTEDRIEKLEDRFETLFGSISDKQKELLAKQKSHISERHKIRVERREKLHEKFKEIFEMDLSREAKIDYFVEAFSNYQKNYPEAPKNKEIIKSIIPTLSAEQKEFFEEKTNDLKEIINYYLETDY